MKGEGQRSETISSRASRQATKLQGLQLLESLAQASTVIQSAVASLRLDTEAIDKIFKAIALPGKEPTGQS